MEEKSKRNLKLRKSILFKNLFDFTRNKAHTGGTHLFEFKLKKIDYQC